MKKLLAAVTILVSVLTSGCVSVQNIDQTTVGSTYTYVRQKNDKIIAGDYGGSIVDYQARASEYKKNGTRVVIDGVCYSACMYLISSLSSSNVCATNRADLGFHSIYVITSGTREVIYTKEVKEQSRQDTAVFLSLLPSGVRAKILSKGYPSVYKGDSPQKMTHIEGQEAMKLLGKC